MLRRNFIALLGGAAVLRPLAGAAQSTIPVIGLVDSGSPQRSARVRPRSATISLAFDDPAFQAPPLFDRGGFGHACHEAAAPVRSFDITQREGILARYLEPVLQQLVREGILVGIRGPAGGYRLARPAEQISIGDIVRVVDGLEAGEDPMADPAESVLGRAVGGVAGRRDAQVGGDIDRRASPERAAGIAPRVQPGAAHCAAGYACNPERGGQPRRDLVPVNSKKCDAGIRHRPTGRRRPSERKLSGPAAVLFSPSSQLCSIPAAPHTHNLVS